jgi:hypothetical protein
MPIRESAAGVKLSETRYKPRRLRPGSLASGLVVRPDLRENVVRRRGIEFPPFGLILLNDKDVGFRVSFFEKLEAGLCVFQVAIPIRRSGPHRSRKKRLANG